MQIILTEAEIERILLNYLNGQYNASFDHIQWELGVTFVRSAKFSVVDDHAAQ
jgi:hypothetical protein